MTSTIAPATRAAGLWAAVPATVCALTSDVGQLVEWLGWLGSAGGPESASTSLGIIVLLTPSLLLGSAFVVLVVAVHQTAPASTKVWSQTAIAFATAYAVLTGLNHFVQLTLVAPRMLKGRVAGIEPFLFTPFDSFSYSMDVLG